MRAAARDGVSGEVFNVACGKAYNLLELVKIVNEILNKNIEPKFMPPRPGDVKHTLADVTKMRKLLKFDPKIDFVLGLRKTIEYFRSVGEKG